MEPEYVPVEDDIQDTEVDVEEVEEVEEEPVEETKPEPQYFVLTPEEVMNTFDVPARLLKSDKPIVKQQINNRRRSKRVMRAPMRRSARLLQQRYDKRRELRRSQKQERRKLAKEKAMVAVSSPSQ